MSLIRRPSDKSKNDTSSTGMLLDDSAMSFGFNMDEANALEKLAAITDEMTMVQDDDDLSGLSILDKEDSSMELPPDETHEPKRGMPLPLAATKIARPAVGSHTRRNTCGTLYVGSTMADPDKDATIQVRHEIRQILDFCRQHFETNVNTYAIRFGTVHLRRLSSPHSAVAARKYRVQLGQ